MDGPDLRIAVARALALTPATRLLAVAADDLVDAETLAVFVALGPTAAGPRSVVADPHRLPLVEGLADRALVRLAALGDPPTALREIWRVLAPAGWLVLVVPLPPRRSLRRPVVQRLRRRRTARLLATCMFEATSVEVTPTALVVRAEKRDGFGVAPVRRQASLSGARQPARERTNTA